MNDIAGKEITSHHIHITTGFGEFSTLSVFIRKDQRVEMLCATLDLYEWIKLKWLFTGMEIAIGPVYKSMSVDTKTASLCEQPHRRVVYDFLILCYHLMSSRTLHRRHLLRKILFMNAYLMPWKKAGKRLDSKSITKNSEELIHDEL